MQAQPGCMALLLGSGVSRTAPIPTGWDVALILARRLAVLKGEPEPADAAEWFKGSFQRDLGYDAILELLGATPAIRQAMMRGFFEPTPEEREQQLKEPTKAHRAIADLVAGGFVRVIVTTNFDKLLEQAVSDTGISPTVVSSVDGIAGAPPLPHVKCLILKVHGDYLDIRTRNSEAELASYEPELADYVQRIAEDFGLVACGWSADYDVALKQAITSARRRAYPVFWCSVGDPKPAALKFIEHTNATLLRIPGADEFFVGLRDKVVALDTMAQKKPVSAAITLTTAKRYMAKDEHRIALHDLLVGEVQRMRETFPRATFSNNHAPLSTDTMRERLDAIVRALGPLPSIMAAAGFWRCRDAAFPLLFEAALDLANPSGGSVTLENLSFYPAMMLYYAAGITAHSVGDLSLFAKLVDRPISRSTGTTMDRLHPWSFIEEGAAALLQEAGQRPLTASDHFLSLLRPHLIEYFPNNVALLRAFDEFEFLLTMLFADATLQATPSNYRAGRMPPIGRYGSRWRSGVLGPSTIANDVAATITQQKGEWPALKAGLFGGSTSRAEEACRSVALATQGQRWT
jgi:hypothetical protein